MTDRGANVMGVQTGKRGSFCGISSSYESEPPISPRVAGYKTAGQVKKRIGGGFLVLPDYHFAGAIL